MKLKGYSSKHFDRGASLWKEAAWLLAKRLFFQTAIPWPSELRCALLRAFGATVGKRVIVRGHVNVTFPWRIVIADDVWLGEEVVILSLARVTIEADVCISQRAFLCTGSHDFRAPAFDLIARPILIKSSSWVAAGAFIGPGVEIGPGTMIAAGAVVTKSAPASCLVRGNPATVEKWFT